MLDGRLLRCLCCPVSLGVVSSNSSPCSNLPIYWASRNCFLNSVTILSQRCEGRDHCLYLLICIYDINSTCTIGMRFTCCVNTKKTTYYTTYYTTLHITSRDYTSRSNCARCFLLVPDTKLIGVSSLISIISLMTALMMWQI